MYVLEIILIAYCNSAEMLHDAVESATSEVRMTCSLSHHLTGKLK